MGDLEQENARLKKELSQLGEKSRQEKAQYETQVAKDRSMTKAYTEQNKAKTEELENVRSQMVRLTRQLDTEISRRDEVEQETQSLERRLHEIEGGGSVSPAAPSKKGSSSKDTEDDANSMSKVSTKLMRVVDQWMTTKDLQQALLRGAGVNDMSFATLVNVLTDCKSLQVLDLGGNQLTMDSCSDICRLITSSPSLSFISVGDNLFSLRCIGYFMTAIMERQNKKKLAPLEVLDLQGNEGFVHAMNAAPPDKVLKMVNKNLGPRLPLRGDVLIAQVLRELWRFLHYTEHPQVANSSQDDVAFHLIDKLTLRKMENALTKVLLLSEDGSGNGAGSKTVHASLVIQAVMDQHEEEVELAPASPPQGRPAQKDGVQLPAIDKNGSRGAASLDNTAGRGGKTASGQNMEAAKQPSRTELRDPFADLKQAFEPPKEKLKTFNLKQIVTRNGTVLMNMLERLLETTEIDARDVETDQTLLEFACTTGNLGLAKLCYRRGANLSARTKKGWSYLNIVTNSKRYDLMEFLHLYAVKINHQDGNGTTALHIAAANDDVDAVCRLIEWGADTNLHDYRKRTPLMTAARKGNSKAAMLLLELGADLNAKDEKNYTAVAHAEAKNNFGLMDRLVLMGGKGIALPAKGDALKGSKSSKTLGQVTVTASMLKSSSLGRIGKISVNGLPGQLQPQLLKK